MYLNIMSQYCKCERAPGKYKECMIIKLAFIGADYKFFDFVFC